MKVNKTVLNVISIAALYVMLFSVSFTGIFVNAVICALLLLYVLKNKTDIEKIYERFYFSVMLDLLLLALFYRKWADSETVTAIAGKFGMSAFVLVSLIGIPLAILSIKAIWEAVSWSYRKIGKYEGKSSYLDEPFDKTALLVCVISAIGIITICSRSSFIYPYNDWYDPNCFFTVGKSMMNGIVPYRDLNEQKGPLLYLAHGFAWLLSHRSFIFIYFLECLSLTIFLYYSYKVMRLYADRKVLLLVPVLGVMTCTTNAFYRGDSAEEFSLSFTAISLWLFLRNIEKGTCISKKEAILIGVYSGCIFWIKFSLLGMYLGRYCVYVVWCIRNKQSKQIWETTKYIILGVLIVTAPFLIYFAINNAIFEWLKVYVYDNVFIYITGTLAENMMQGIYNIAGNNAIIYYLCLAGLVFMFIGFTGYKRAYLISMLLWEFFLIYVGGQHYFYYSLIMNSFALFGLLFIYRICLEGALDRFSIKNAIYYATVVVCLIVSFVITPNRYFIGVDKELLPQYKFAKIIEADKDENTTLLNYMFLDGGFYTICDILPNCRYFCKTNMESQEMIDAQNEYIKNGDIEYIVSRREVNDSKYELISKCDSYTDGKVEVLHYYLYKLKQ